MIIATILTVAIITVMSTYSCVMPLPTSLHVHFPFSHSPFLSQLIDISSKGQAMIQRMEDSSKPVVAAIHGSCLGGGCEVSSHLQMNHTVFTLCVVPTFRWHLAATTGLRPRIPRPSLDSQKWCLDSYQEQVAPKDCPNWLVQSLGMDVRYCQYVHLP